MSALFFPHRVLHAPSLAVAPGGRGARSVKALGWNPKPHWSFLVLDSGHRPLVSAERDSLTWVRASHWHPPWMSSDQPATLVGRCLQSKTFSAQPSPSACHTTQLCHTSLWGALETHETVVIGIPQAPASTLSPPYTSLRHPLFYWSAVWTEVLVPCQMWSLQPSPATSWYLPPALGTSQTFEVSPPASYPYPGILDHSLAWPGRARFSLISYPHPSKSMIDI